MSDEQAAVPEPDPDEAPGWRVLDPDGNVVQSGPMTVAQSVFTVGETDDSEGGRQ